MTRPMPAGSFAIAAKPWLQREAGECAYPVAGAGEGVISCCRPVWRGDYCAGHRAAMFLPANPNEARELLAYLEAAQRRAEAGDLA